MKPPVDLPESLPAADQSGGASELREKGQRHRSAQLFASTDRQRHAYKLVIDTRETDRQLLGDGWRPNDASTIAGPPSGDERSAQPQRTFRSVEQGQTPGKLAIVALVTVMVTTLAIAMLSKKPPQRTRFQLDGNPYVRVWADTSTGLYFCPGSTPYGRGRGSYMTQAEAQRASFRPALQQPCE